MMTLSEQHMSIYEIFIHKLEQFIGAFDMLDTGH